MKLLNCTSCHDILRLPDGRATCACGAAAARLLRDGRSAEVEGHGRILEIEDDDYGASVSSRRGEMTVFVLPDSHSRVHRIRKTGKKPA